MNYIIYFLKKIILSFFLLYSFNVITSNFNLVIPINIFTIVIVSFLGFPGIFALFMLFILIF